MCYVLIGQYKDEVVLIDKRKHKRDLIKQKRDIEKENQEYDDKVLKNVLALEVDHKLKPPKYSNHHLIIF